MLEMGLHRPDTEQIQLDSTIITLSHYYRNKNFGDTSGCLTWGDRNDFSQKHEDIHPTLERPVTAVAVILIILFGR